MFFFFSLCWSPWLFNGSFSFNRSLLASFKYNWIADNAYAVFFSCFYRYCRTESASWGGAGGVSHGVRRAPLQIHWWRRPNKTYTSTEAVFFLSPRNVRVSNNRNLLALVLSELLNCRSFFTSIMLPASFRVLECQRNRHKHTRTHPTCVFH